MKLKRISILIISCMLTLSLVAGCSKGKKENNVTKVEETSDALYFASTGAVQYFDNVNKIKGTEEAEQLGEGIYAKDSDDYDNCLGEDVRRMNLMMGETKDGKYVIYPQNYEAYSTNFSNGSYDLYFKKNKKKQEGKLIEKDVEYHYVLADNRVIYQSDEEVFLYDLKKEEKIEIDKEVSEFVVSVNEEKVLLQKALKDNYKELWLVSLKEGTKSKKIGEGEYLSNLTYTKNFKTIAYVCDGLYVSENGNEAEKVLERNWGRALIF